MVPHDENKEAKEGHRDHRKPEGHRLVARFTISHQPCHRSARLLGVCDERTPLMFDSSGYAVVLSQ